MSTHVEGLSVRAERLTDRLSGAGVDLFVVANLVNVRYLTGYTGSNGLALVGRDRREFLTDFRYVEQAAEEVDPTFERHNVSAELLDAVVDLLPAGGFRLGFEEDHITVKQHAQLAAQLGDR